MANPELFRQICGRTIWDMLLERRRTSLAVVGALLLALSALSLGSVASAAPAPLVGTFRITAGACSGGASGSYFRMILPTGNATGPYIDNADSTCAGDKTYTLFTPGTDGGLITGANQPAPSPGFDGKGNSLAVRIIRPVRFFGVAFSVSTNPKDLQTGGTTKLPSLQHDGGKLTGDLSAFAATWNKQAFNQGAPKPDGSSPGNTAPVAGTFDAATNHFSLTWASQIVGGPFDNFTGQWHLEGTFVPAAAGGSTPTVAPAAQGSGGGSTPTPDPAVATTVAGSGAAAPSTTVAGSESAAPAAPTDVKTATPIVDDESFAAPAWLVVVLALAGIGGVVALLVLGPRRRAA
jgi:hypothetical protein